jgi:hypothetical protein
MIAILAMAPVMLQLVELLEFRDLYIYFYRICRQLSNLLARFGRSCSLNRFLTPCLHTRCESYMLVYGLNMETFLVCIRQLKGVIGGGFALAVFDGTLYLNSDIDLYVPILEGEELEKKLMNSNLIQYLELEGYKKCPSSVHSCNPGYPYGFIEFYNNSLKKKIQIIAKHWLTDMNVSFGEYVVSEYDMTAVMNYIELCDSKKIKFYSQYIDDVIDNVVQINVRDCELGRFASYCQIGRLARSFMELYEFNIRCIYVPRFFKYSNKMFHLIDCNKCIKITMKDSFIDVLKELMMKYVERRLMELEDVKYICVTNIYVRPYLSLVT